MKIEFTKKNVIIAVIIIVLATVVIYTTYKQLKRDEDRRFAHTLIRQECRKNRVSAEECEEAIKKFDDKVDKIEAGTDKE